MSLLTIAQVLSGEALVSPGGVVDTETAAGSDAEMWLAEPAFEPPAVLARGAPQREREAVTLEVPVLI